VDLLMESYAIETTFGGGAESSFSRLNTLKRHLDLAVPLWGDLLARPRFDSLEVEVWRGREVESVLRREDNPTRLAFTAFNHLMYGDHSVGWEMTLDDVLPEELSQERLREVHRRIFCTGNMVLGISGDVSWREAEALLIDLLEGWPSCPGTLPELPVPEIRTGGGVFLIPKDLTQSTVVMAHPGGIRQDASPDYFASRVGNSILGASGFTSRIMKRVRTEEGYAYSASSLWTTPIRYQGLVGALTQTRAEKTVAATRLILDIMQEMRESPPPPEEVATTVSDVVNGFVFNFQDPSQILARQIHYLAHGMEEDWLENYLEGIQSVREEDVHRVFRRYLHPEEMTILILGNPDLFEDSLETLGEVTVIELGENREPSPTPSAPPNGSPRPLR
jgi:predicted Zn-dependent peptidase